MSCRQKPNARLTSDLKRWPRPRVSRRRFAVSRLRTQRVSLEFIGELNRPPMERTEDVVRLFEKAKALAAEFGRNLEETKVGGASDGNFVGALGIPSARWTRDQRQRGTYFGRICRNRRYSFPGGTFGKIAIGRLARISHKGNILSGNTAKKFRMKTL